MIEVGQIYKWYPYKDRGLDSLGVSESECLEFQIIARLEDRDGWAIKYTSSNQPEWAATNQTWLRATEILDDLNKRIFLEPDQEPKTRLHLILDEWIP